MDSTYKYDCLEEEVTRHRKKVESLNLLHTSFTRQYIQWLYWRIYNKSKYYYSVPQTISMVERCLLKRSKSVSNLFQQYPIIQCFPNIYTYIDDDISGMIQSEKELESFRQFIDKNLYHYPSIPYPEGITSLRGKQQRIQEFRGENVSIRYRLDSHKKIVRKTFANSTYISDVEDYLDLTDAQLPSVYNPYFRFMFERVERCLQKESDENKHLCIPSLTNEEREELSLSRYSKDTDKPMLELLSEHKKRVLEIHSNSKKVSDYLSFVSRDIFKGCTNFRHYNIIFSRIERCLTVSKDKDSCIPELDKDEKEELYKEMKNSI